MTNDANFNDTGAAANCVNRVAGVYRNAVTAAPGTNGSDGLGVKDFDVIYDGRRKFTLRWANGERLVEKSFALPIPIYCGVWEAGKAYDANDSVTYGGNTFIARCWTEKRPMTDDWQLWVKKGGDGTNGKEGKQGPPGPQGRAGHDLTQLGPDGHKW